MKKAIFWLVIGAVAAAVAAPSVGAKARPVPGGGPATGCSALATNAKAKGGSAPDQLECGPGLPDLRAAGSCDRTTVPSGNQITCTLEIHNDGTSAATLPVGTLLTHFAYPAGFTLNTFTVPAPTSDWSCTFGGALPEQGICSVAVEQTIAPGGALTFVVTGITPYISCIDTAQSGNFTAQIDPNGTVAEADEANNTLTVGLTVTPLNC